LTAGDFTAPFDEFAWGGDYSEAGPWQLRFYVPFDPKGLKSLFAQNGTALRIKLFKCDIFIQYHRRYGYVYPPPAGTNDARRISSGWLRQRYPRNDGGLLPM
jgi:hypothetical protein